MVEVLVVLGVLLEDQGASRQKVRESVGGNCTIYVQLVFVLQCTRKKRWMAREKKVVTVERKGNIVNEMFCVLLVYISVKQKQFKLSYSQRKRL